MMRFVTDVVRTTYEHWERGDFGWTGWADPDIEFVLADGPTPGEWRGIPAMAAAWGELISSFEDLRVEAEEIRPLDDERVLVLTRNSGRGKASGVEIGRVTTNGANVFHVRDGVVKRLVLYWDRANAFEDLGLDA
jgi:ketosteroid isomerase-like protein